MHSDSLSGQAFEEWLFDLEHRTLPDFLDTQIWVPWRCQQEDILALRALAKGKPGDRVPTHFLAGLMRLQACGIIERICTPTGVVYFLSPYSYEVLMHNVSYKEPR